ncbi:hypothetical protein MTTB_09720 [Methanothermobacter tenebrarum]|uniref:Uncharacterized protein n=1 Tax=Methanothermobacter tenebrarum TaxID=680118 RepID=A0ABM7YEA4_9EURY|nr:hypothetical protein [Methanothermobacter tenebrarum]MDD3454150.1 hypothetical protein [Methanobacteriales archaeon]MDI6881319.1 hypothetical protein [Methanothermobacter sp.]MDX9693148.1 hypothetical protein [Methanothermobacter sp.]BDH79593.1 hypothetical protein MTTB_09720 [Methanothermobacter tenebrarum]HOQ20090.1 hypothetical protein [Methanothermobacter sp.]
MVKVTEILDEAHDLAEKIKKYRSEAESEIIACWVYDVILTMEKLAKIVEELQDRVDLLEEELEGKKF